MQEQHSSPPNSPPVAPGFNGGQTFRQQLASQGWQQPPQPQPQQPIMPQYPGQRGDPVSPVNQEKAMFPQLPGKMYGMEGEGPPNYNVPWNSQYSGPGGRQYKDGNSHIFNHKGNGLVADSDSSGVQYESRNDYNAKYAGNNMYYNNRPPASPNMWQPNQPPQQHDVGNLGRTDGERKLALPSDYYYEDNQGMAGQEGRFHHQEARPYPHPPALNNNIAEVPANPVKMPPQPLQPAPETSLESKLQQDLTSMPYRNKGSIDVHVKPDKTIKHHNHQFTTEESRPKSVGSAKKRLGTEDGFTNENILIEELDAQAAKPTGAILSLALGLCITGLLVTLVGCRVRVIRKRLRRGTKTYAHDADYLVNGMYL